ncbi:alpha/beta hydrolase [Paracidovorax cattleyae]|uniref:Acetyl esterase/lipase n=1 Tax=Paracidovorax cattleyae TaxID=80868 RepID=A0A1H0TBU8_9BURK|nr:alpha/beta hydrolase [Paracidovorax cattleyae]AVS75517.1 alpha/beta hydrolase [Paracidovorax cattleyae]SDP51281.1 Acetyl esterase/lipase [Paracidovorax cattleyae]
MSDDDHGQPNPLLNALSNAVAAVRADDDQLALARAHEALGPRAIEKLDVAEARRQPTVADAVNHLLREQGRSTDPERLVPGVQATETTVDGATGPLRATVYTPETAPGPLPVVLYFHGGGWVIASKEVYDGGARGLAREAHAIVVSVDYRQAPENRFPAAWDDAFAAYRWVTENAGVLGGDPERIALAGESAGGNLAVATAIAVRDAGLRAPRHVLSVYPVAQTNLNTESYLENAIAKPLNRAMVKWFVDHLVRSEEDLADPRLSLVDARLEGLPPVTIINARIDPLRSDGAKLEKALQEAGVPVERRDYEGVAHEFFGAAAVLEKARQAQAYAGERLRAALRA